MKTFIDFEKPTFVVSSAKCNENCHHDVTDDLFDLASSDGTSITSQQFDFHESEACCYRVAWSINAHMTVGAATPKEALKQHDVFRKTLNSSGAEVLEVPFVHGAYDSVFVKDNALLVQDRTGLHAYLANPLNRERKLEQEARRKTLEELGFQVAADATETFEGGDIVMLPNGCGAFLGYGFRSTRHAAEELSDVLHLTVTPLELRDPHFYHLDTALAVLNDGTAFACRDAFTDQSWKDIHENECIRRVVTVSREEAMRFALNLVEVDNTVVIGSHVPQTIAALEALGKQVRVTPLNQFQFAGGSAACLTAKVHHLC